MANNEITTYFLNAQFSMASYANLAMGMTDDAYINALMVDDRFTEELATEFANRFQIVSVQPNTDEGFRAVVFRDIVENEFTMAITGSELEDQIVDDWLRADFGDIGGDGIAVSQAIDMYNYYLRLTAVAGQPTRQYSFTPLPEDAQFGTFESFELQLAPPENGPLIPIVNGPLYGQDFNLSGHSLGGHLALVMSRLAPGFVNEVYTYNAPGFDFLQEGQFSDAFFEDLFDLEFSETQQSTINPFDFPVDKINIATAPEDYISAVGSFPNNDIEFFSETTNPISGHLIVPFTDSLAVYDLLEFIDPNITIETATEILNNASNIPGSSLEKIVTSLTQVFGNVQTVEIGNRDQLYSVIDALRTNLVQSPNLSFVSLEGMDAATLAANAEYNLATLYALVNLNPFTISGSDAASTQALYQSFLDRGDLDITDYSDEYLQDRAQMLKHIIGLNDKDISYVNDPADNSGGSGSGATPFPSDIQEFYRDLETGIEINPAGPLRADAINTEQNIFGGSDSDSAIGGNADMRDTAECVSMAA